MVQLKSFRGIGYSSELNPLDNILTLPFDEIDENLKREYFKRSEYNFVRVNLPTKHEDSLNIVQEWLSKNILKMDEKEHIYPYVQEFSYNGKKFVRRGFFSLVNVDPTFSEIIPHENIYQGPKNDRLELLKKLEMDIEPIFFLYNDVNGKCNFLYDLNNLIAWGEEPEGIENKLYVSDENPDPCSGMKFVIADGHHRYTAALEFSRVNPIGKYVMGVFVNVHDEGLIILPSNKIVKNISEDFNINLFQDYFDIEEVNVFNEDIGLKKFILIYKNKYYKLSLKENLNAGSKKYNEMGAVIFSEIILKRILKISNTVENIKTFRGLNELNVEKLGNSMAFLFDPVKPLDVWEIALNGEKMPQKSTYFYPKLISGLRMYKKSF